MPNNARATDAAAGLRSAMMSYTPSWLSSTPQEELDSYNRSYEVHKEDLKKLREDLHKVQRLMEDIRGLEDILDIVEMKGVESFLGSLLLEVYNSERRIANGRKKMAEIAENIRLAEVKVLEAEEEGEDCESRN